MEVAREIYRDEDNFTLYKDAYEAARGSDALVMVTEWKLYWVPDFQRLAEEMNRKILVDARNVWSKESALNHGFTLHAIGRPTVG